MTSRSGDNSSTAGPGGLGTPGGCTRNVSAWHRRMADVTSPTRLVRNRTSESLNRPDPADLHRSSHAQQPYRSLKTADATSVIPYRVRRPAHVSPGARARTAGRWAVPTVSRTVQWLTSDTYLSRTRRGSSGRQGTSATGEVPTDVPGSVSSHAYASNGTTWLIAPRRASLRPRESSDEAQICSARRRTCSNADARGTGPTLRRPAPEQPQNPGMGRR